MFFFGNERIREKVENIYKLKAAKGCEKQKNKHFAFQNEKKYHCSSSLA